MWCVNCCDNTGKYSALTFVLFGFCLKQNIVEKCEIFCRSMTQTLTFNLWSSWVILFDILNLSVKLLFLSPFPPVTPILNIRTKYDSDLGRKSVIIQSGFHLSTNNIYVHVTVQFDDLIRKIVFGFISGSFIFILW